MDLNQDNVVSRFKTDFFLTLDDAKDHGKKTKSSTDKRRTEGNVLYFCTMLVTFLIQISEETIVDRQDANISQIREPFLFNYSWRSDTGYFTVSFTSLGTFIQNISVYIQNEWILIQYKCSFISNVDKES